MASSVVKSKAGCEFFLNSSTSIFLNASAQIEEWEALLVVLAFGIFFALLAQGFSWIRLNIYKDKSSLDTAFDAGGKVNVGLTATTIVSQWTWAATLLTSSTVASKYGISGPFWYAAGATIQILLFSMLSVQLKIRAPGAKTFLQVIKGRFGSRTHKVFCVYALVTNMIVTSMLMLGGAAVMTSLVSDMSKEYATMLFVAMIGAYTYIGGLGATFYVSYFNTAIIYIIMLIFIMKVYGNSNSPDNPLGTVEKVFDLLDCSKAPDDNKQNSFLTFASFKGLMFGLINVVGNFGTVFVDQSYWQSSVAAKPREGALGFLFGGIAWFSIPFAFATTMGLAFVALSTKQGSSLLTQEEIDSGLVATTVATTLLGRSGEYLLMIMVLMSVTSTASAEVMAVTSILIYDIYQIYLKPYRKVLDANSCILCGKGRGRLANPLDKCLCHSMTTCGDCKSDDSHRAESRVIKPEYKCVMHGAYRAYTDYLLTLKSWSLMWCLLLILPMIILLRLCGLNLSWVYLFMGVLIGSAVLPIALSMFWDRLTGNGMTFGAIGGTVSALITWVAVTYSEGDEKESFLTNSGKELPMLCGNLVSILSGGLITVVVSLITNCSFDEDKRKECWENTRDIDNPLCPWTELYARDLNLTGADRLDNRPSLEDVSRKFRHAKYIANISAVIMTLVLIIMWPSCMVSFDVMDLASFTHWVNLSKVWAIFAALFVIICPLVTEGLDIYRTYMYNKNAGSDELMHFPVHKKVTSRQIHPAGSKMRKLSSAVSMNGVCSTTNLPAETKEIETEEETRSPVF